MRSRFPGPLRLVFAARPPAEAERPEVCAPLVSLVELTLYAADCVARGRLALTAERVTDLMNERAEYEFVDAFVQSFQDDLLSVSTLIIARDEILAVGVTGPRGDPSRRKRTRALPVELRVGRYDVTGNIHVVPGADAVSGFGRGRIMVPLTEATIAYDSAGERFLTRVGTILVNAKLTDWIGPAMRSDVRPPEGVPELQGVSLAEDLSAVEVREA